VVSDMTSDRPLLHARDLVLGYGRLVVLKVQELTLRHGDYVGVVGPNGAGKTTLLKALTGILNPMSGAVSISSPDASRPVSLGYVAQSTSLDEGYPVSTMDVVLMGRISKAGPCRRFGADCVEAAHRALERVQMAHRCDWPFCELSRGQQQRVLLARALAGQPDVLCLDEPTNFLDPGAQVSFMQALDDMRTNEAMTIIVVTHLLQAVVKHASRVWLVQGGGLRALSNKEDIENELSYSLGASRAEGKVLP